jgi:hypothetical protein
MSSAVGMSAIASFLQKRRPLLQCNSLVSASKDCAESEEVQGKWMGGLRIII